MALGYKSQSRFVYSLTIAYKSGCICAFALSNGVNS